MPKSTFVCLCSLGKMYSRKDWKTQSSFLSARVSAFAVWVYKLELIYNSCIEVPFSSSFSFESSKEQFFFTVVASKQSGLDHFSHVIKLGAGATLGMYLEFMVEQPRNCHIAAYLHALLTKSL